MAELLNLDLNDLEQCHTNDLTVPSILGYHATSWVAAVQRLGPAFSTWIDGEQCILIASTDANKEAWRTPDDWSYRTTDVARVFRTQLGEDHVTTLDDEPHRRLRKLILPAFGIAALHRDIRTTCAILEDGLHDWVEQPVDLHPAASRLFTRALTRTQIMSDADDDLIDTLCQFEDEFIAGTQLSAKMQGSWFKRPSYQNQRQRAFDYFESTATHRKHGARLDDSLDLLLQRTPPAGMAALTDSELAEAVYLLSVAGVGNIANLLCALLWSIHGTPWVARLQDELQGHDLSALSGMRELPVLKALITETERLYPPAAVIPKRAVTDIDFLGVRIPVGTLILHLHTLAHYEAERYPEPFQFNPTRWLDMAAAKPNAFGGGKHLCLGMGVTRAYLPLMTALMIRDYDVEVTAAPASVPIDRDFEGAPLTTTMPVRLLAR